MRTSVSIIVLLIFFANCKSQISKVTSFTPQTKIENYGDTLRIETVRIDKTTLKKNYIDLKGVSDDGFDSSFEVVSRYFEKKPVTFRQDGYPFSVADFDFVLEKKSFLKRINKKIRSLEQSNAFPFEIDPYQELARIVAENENLDSLESFENDFFIAQLLSRGTLLIEARNGKIQPHSLLIELYTTPFSGGRKFYIKSSEGDTIPIFSFNEWMK
ncbi:hypothetical protein J0A68_21665 [Algoriphagus sp. H41]|uniref:Uncharacterized protein n=1 Tax=Algoriphagus oliviformis TaxID=2811231 RepID=A0ABS3C8Z0_9BACT|nr:hypothetical protein [Algoriphagus oliviformis]MBN7813578.1 hypothetical protein [Algoriphagus oliviformis]